MLHINYLCYSFSESERILLDSLYLL